MALLMTAVSIVQLVHGQPMSQIAPVRTIVAIQESDGLTEADLTPAHAKRLEDWSVVENRRKIAQSLARSGQDAGVASRLRINSSSVVNVIGGKKLAVIRINIDDSIREVSVMGFRGEQFLRVGCLRASNHDIPALSGECGRIVRETFGISF